MTQYKLHFEIFSFWQAGTGRGGGSLLDTTAHRDADGLPCLPGRTVKGLLRDAVMRAETWGYIAPATTLRWFGSEALEEGRLREVTEPGALRISDAVLDNQLTDFLRYQKHNDADYFRDLCKGFFHPLYATAIESASGSAKYNSLRSIEVVVPAHLTAELRLLQDLPDGWHQDLDKCLPLIRAAGSWRSRGLGRVQVSLESIENGN